MDKKGRQKYEKICNFAFSNNNNVYLDSELFKDFLNHREITWLGIDFSKAKFTLSGFSLPQDVLQRYFIDWNTLIITDQKKYDIRMSFRKPIMNYDLSWATKLNKSVKSNNLLCDFITADAVYSDEEMIAHVEKTTANVTCETPFALFFIVESFDNHTKLGTVWVVVMNMSEKKVVLCEKFMKSPGGFNLRNYWGRVFYNLFFDIQKYAFLRWENMVKNTEI